MGDKLPQSSRLRARILTAVGALVVLSLFASTLSLYRITGLHRSIDSVNRKVLPLSRIFSQMKGDASVLAREWELVNGLERRRVPKWTVEVLGNQLSRVEQMVFEPRSLFEKENLEPWKRWQERFQASLKALQNYLRGEEVAVGIVIDQIVQDVDWGSGEVDRIVKAHFGKTESQLEELETGLQLILIVVVLLSLSLLWFGERALRPLAEMTRVAREITQRGLHKSDKSRLPALDPGRNDEVGQLAREFHAMATTLLEREQLVEQQKERLQEQNRLLKEMGDMKIQLQESEHMATLGRLSAQVAHEVRNPLHSIGLEAEMALEYATKSGQSAVKSSIQSILESVSRLNAITDHYLKFARTSSGQRKVVDLGEVLDRVLASYSPSCQAKGIRVDWKREPIDLRIVGDGELLEQVLGNLFRNAIQAVPDRSGRIEWSLSKGQGKTIEISIVDNGPGIPEEVKEKLFTPFMTTKAQGTGIGLPFVKKVVEEHEGAVRYEPVSGAMSGARFVMTLPAVATVSKTDASTGEVQA